MKEGQAVCLQCGTKAGDGNEFCSNCGKPIAAGVAVCPNCGFAVKKTSGFSLDGELGGQSKLTMGLICVFLGMLGVHNFMMGETKKGVFKIVMSLCCGISGIFVLIDAVKIFTDKYVIDPTKLF